ncbi:hypothetical protein G3A39_44770 [Paraburkholderia aspalathi]|nr:hypothetical protein [Paraburkholderia aspalathi]
MKTANAQYVVPKKEEWHPYLTTTEKMGMATVIDTRVGGIYAHVDASTALAERDMRCDGTREARIYQE